jgi:NADH dehydrogenase FAD-containing subunit
MCSVIGLGNRGGMAAARSSRDRWHVVVAGGGFAALEVVLGLRALAGRATRISLVSPDAVFAYRPAATLEAFSGSPPRAFDLGMIADDLGVRYHRTWVQSVGGAGRRLRLASGGPLTYDALVLATGARATVAVPGALTFPRPARPAPFPRCSTRARRGQARLASVRHPVGRDVAAAAV